MAVGLDAAQIFRRRSLVDSGAARFLRVTSPGLLFHQCQFTPYIIPSIFRRHFQNVDAASVSTAATTATVADSHHYAYKVYIITSRQNSHAE